MTYFELAQKDLGLSEIVGADDNPKIVAMFKDVGHSWVDNDETAWCAAAVGSWLERSGIKSTGLLNARSYLEWGDKVELADARPGDVVIFSRGDPNGWQGHVALFVEKTSSTIKVLGGNQGNKVSFKNYAVDRLLGVRRPRTGDRPVTKKKFGDGLIDRLAPRGANRITDVLPDLLNEILPEYEITTPKRIALFLANVLTETGGFKSLEENLNYSAKRLRQVWPSRFRTNTEARKYANNPAALAQKVYGGRMGNNKTTDGYRFRGSGFMMTTGRSNFTDVKNVTGIDVVAAPDHLRDDVRTALIAACIFWKAHGLNDHADRTQITIARRKINGGSHGLKSVKRYYRQILPLVADFDLTHEAEKAVGPLIVLTGGSFAFDAPWTYIIFGIGFAATLAYIIWKTKRKQDDVQLSLTEIKGLENISGELDLDVACDGLVDRSGVDQLPDG
jgi:putative chitinase